MRGARVAVWVGLLIGLTSYAKTAEPMAAGMDTLLAEEQTAVTLDASPTPSVRLSWGWGHWGVLLVLLLATAGASVGFVRFAKKRAGWTGTRRYLIETLAAAPVGADGKASVAVIRVGSELVLVGVTASQVSALSTLPRLTEEYLQEQSFDKENFRQAMAEQVVRQSTNIRTGTLRA